MPEFPEITPIEASGSVDAENSVNTEYLPGGSDGEESAYDAGDLGLIPGLEDPLEKRKATHFNILA